MATVVSPLVKVVRDKLGFEFREEMGLFFGGVEKGIIKLNITLHRIDVDALEDAEKRLMSDKSLCNLLKNLKDAVYDADDVVDELRTEALRRRRRMESPGRLKGQVRDFFSSHNPNAFNYRISQKIKDAVVRLDYDCLRFMFPLRSSSLKSSLKVREDETSPVVIASEVYGRDDDKKKIVNVLLNEDNDKDISVLAIVGFGGIGKTTLAQLVYNDEKIKSMFVVRGWVCVSDEFDVRGIARKVIQCINKEVNCAHLDLDPLGRLLRETLGGKRFLLVLDDVWNGNQEKWESLESLLACGKKGSKIIVTTRDGSVARVMRSVLPYELDVLSLDDCWNLFRERAFGAGREKQTRRLVEIGKGIISKCGGLPLAAKALGSLLSLKRKEDEWLAIENSEMWTFLDDQNEIPPALWLSYYHLPPHLKQCFVYCSLFPKYYVFDKEKLISLWIGEGFVKSSDEGNQYFYSLSRISFFDQVVEECNFSYELINRRYKMDDLMHDLACNVAKDEFSRIVIRKEIKPSDNCRYLSLFGDNVSPNVIDLSCAAKKIRSLLLCDCSSIIIKDMILQLSHIRVLDLNGSDISVLPYEIWRLKYLKFLDLSGTGIETMPYSIASLYNLQMLTLRNCVKLQMLPLEIGRLQNLRSLDLSHTNIHSFPKSIDGLHSLQTLNLSNCSKLQVLPLAICKLQNLRLLDLSHTNIQALPESISHLPNLQILNLRECSELRELPEGIQNMISLNHLDISGCELTCMPRCLGRLHRLQTLPLFVVGTETGRTIMELQELNRIRGVLRITCLSNVMDSEEARGAYLGAKAGLHSLELWWRKEWTRQWGEVVINWEAFSPPSRENTDVELLENLKPHPNLRHLTIEDYGGNRFPSWLTEKDIPNLESFSLYNLERCERLPPLGRLRSLKHLQMDSMHALKRIDSLRGTFLSLKYLKLWNLPSLEEWFMPQGEMFPSLERLIIVGCPKLEIKSQLPSSLVELELESVNTELLAGGCLYGLSRLRKLKIAHFEASESGWQGLQYLTALENLEIMNCYLACLPDCIMQQYFPSLWTLKLTLNSDLETLGKGKEGEPPVFFSELRYLNIQGCDELTALPEWLCRLTFLQSLELSYCDNLAVVPNELRRRLPQLTIRGCPKLEERGESSAVQD